MSDARSFAALRYARDLAARIAPPYDVLTDAQREAYAREPENVVHVTLPPGAEGARDYAAAARTFARWIEEGTLVRDPEPRLYVLYERTPDGPTRRGFLLLLRLADYAQRRILPHERTMPGPKADRLLLTRAVRANLEPLFFLYEDREGALESVLGEVSTAPSLARTHGPDGTEIALFGTAEAEPLRRVQGLLASRPVVIADGHHRYETMLRYRDEERGSGEGDPDAPPEFVLAYLCNAFDPGTRLRAIHRLVERPPEEVRTRAEAAGFTRRALPVDADADALLSEIGALRSEAHAIALVGKAGPPLLLLRPRGRDLDVDVLHREILTEGEGAIRYDADAARVEQTARAGSGAGILLNAISPEELFAVVQAGRLLPQKSTYFSPKVPSGLLFRELRQR